MRPPNSLSDVPPFMSPHPRRLSGIVVQAEIFPQTVFLTSALHNGLQPLVTFRVFPSDLKPLQHLLLNLPLPRRHSSVNNTASQFPL